MADKSKPRLLYLANHNTHSTHSILYYLTDREELAYWRLVVSQYLLYQSKTKQFSVFFFFIAVRCSQFSLQI